jgi:hypothetical protein
MRGLDRPGGGIAASGLRHYRELTQVGSRLLTRQLAAGEDDIVSPTNGLPITSPPPAVGHSIRAQMGNSWRVPRLLGKSNPFLMITDPPYGIELDSEWRDRAGLNGRGPAEPSYLNQRTKGHQQTSISGDTRADWSDAFALVPSLEVG